MWLKDNNTSAASFIDVIELPAPQIYLVLTFYNSYRDWGGRPAVLRRERLVTVPQHDNLIKRENK